MLIDKDRLLELHRHRRSDTVRGSAFLGAFVVAEYLLYRAFLRHGSPVTDARVRRRIWVETGVMVVLIVLTVAASLWLEAGTYVVWMLPVPGYLAAVAQSVRKYIEHMGLTGSTALGL